MFYFIPAVFADAVVVPPVYFGEGAQQNSCPILTGVWEFRH
jgi:hypothetical protein